MKLREMYFVNNGVRNGQFLILIDYDKITKMFSVLGLPESEPLYITENDIKAGIEHKILEFVEKLPNKHFKACQNEFQYRINIK